MVRLLVGDIGKRVNLSLLETEKDVNEIKDFSKDFRVLYMDSYPLRIYSDLSEMIKAFLADAPGTLDLLQEPITKACFAVPSPVTENKIVRSGWEKSRGLTKESQWGELNTESLIQKLKIEQISLINDFEAVCYGIHLLRTSRQIQEDLYLLNKEKYSPTNNDSCQTNFAVVGAGTGLGEAFMVIEKEEIKKVCATEGAHADFPCRFEEEYELYEFLRKKYCEQNQDSHHISVERIVSGQGIIDIYQFLREDKNLLKNKQSNPELQELDDDGLQELDDEIKIWENENKEDSHGDRGEKSVDPAAEISKFALLRKSELCQKTMKIFLSAFGREIRNFILKTWSNGGLYIAGGIAPRILPLLEDDDTFREALGKDLYDKMPIYVVLNRNVVLMGAAFCAVHL
jgi:glucokinase